MATKCESVMKIYVKFNLLTHAINVSLADGKDAKDYEGFLKQVDCLVTLQRQCK